MLRITTNGCFRDYFRSLPAIRVRGVSRGSSRSSPRFLESALPMAASWSALASMDLPTEGSANSGLQEAHVAGSSPASPFPIGPVFGPCIIPYWLLHLGTVRLPCRLLMSLFAGQGLVLENKFLCSDPPETETVFPGCQGTACGIRRACDEGSMQWDRRGPSRSLRCRRCGHSWSGCRVCSHRVGLGGEIWEKTSWNKYPENSLLGHRKKSLCSFLIFISSLVVCLVEFFTLSFFLRSHSFLRTRSFFCGRATFIHYFPYRPFTKAGSKVPRILTKFWDYLYKHQEEEIEKTAKQSTLQK